MTIPNGFVQNIWGVGRNFKAHATEMNANLPTEPLIFLKSGASIQKSKEVELPKWTKEVHHEIELVLQIDNNLNPFRAALGLDLTERHFQTEAKSKGLPWTLAKSFYGATVLGDWIPWSESILENKIQLQINGVVRQEGFLSEMIFSPSQILQYLFDHFPLQPQDLIMMGTPSGVGPLVHGDQLQAKLGQLITQNWIIQKS